MPRGSTWVFIPNEFGIALMSLPGGQVWRWARQRAVRIERLAKVFVPKRTLELADSIHVEYEGAAPQHVVMYVAADAPHAVFVHEGAGLPGIVSIFPTDHKYLKLSPGPAFPFTTYAYGVRGQVGKPFLADALDAVMRDL